jgi:hypothetical protein
MNEIYVDKFETYPLELINWVKNNAENFNVLINKNIEKNDLEIIIDFEENRNRNYSLFEKLLTEFQQVLLNNEEKYNFAGYHVTRILNEDEIIKNGLLALEYGTYSKRMINLLQRNNISEDEINLAMSEIKKIYEGSCGTKKEQVCFFIPYSRLYTYDLFAQNYGGEIAEWAIAGNDKLTNVWEILTHNGTPVVVEFRFVLSDLELGEDTFFTEIIIFLYTKIFMNYNYSIRFDGCFKKSITPEDIMNIIRIE